MSIGESEEHFLSRNHSTFFHRSLFISPIDILDLQSIGNLNFELETGDVTDALCYSIVNDVACKV